VPAAARAPRLVLAESVAYRGFESRFHLILAPASDK
jgi:hypothetical protein